MTTWFCWDCKQIRELDGHARCVSCGSGRLTPASSASSDLRPPTYGAQQSRTRLQWKHERAATIEWYGIQSESEFGSGSV